MNVKISTQMSLFLVKKIQFPDIFAKGVVFLSPTIDCEILIQTRKPVKLRNVQGANL